jgi:hypothetical protein
MENKETVLMLKISSDLQDLSLNTDFHQKKHLVPFLMIVENGML